MKSFATLRRFQLLYAPLLLLTAATGKRINSYRKPTKSLLNIFLPSNLLDLEKRRSKKKI